MSGFCFAYRLATVVLLVQPHPRLFSLLVVDDGGVVSKVKNVALLVQHEGVGVVKEGLRLQRLKNLLEKNLNLGAEASKGHLAHGSLNLTEWTVVRLATKAHLEKMEQLEKLGQLAHIYQLCSI